MKGTYKRAAALALSLALAASLAGCGGASKGSGSAAPAVSSGTEAASGEKTPTVIKVGFNAVQVPATYVDENGDLAGENYETLQLVDDLLEDYVFEYEPVQQDVILTGLDAGTYAFGIGFVKTPERAERYLFPEYPLSAIVRGLILPTRLKDNFTPGTSDEILGQFAAQGLTMIPVEPGSSADSLLTAYNETHDPKVKFDVAEQTDVATSIRYIANGRYDGSQFTTSNYSTVHEEADPNGDTFFLSFDDGAFATWLLFAKGQEELAAAVDGAMQQLFENGTMAAISQKYYGENVFAYIDGFAYADVAPDPNYP
ncbi:MAG: transporter substrate-binding domain-containing protein [Oscillibacter sp.]|nr:transporter substrate-binding domain-containing protein [Oscillibacter sp.]